MNVMRLALERLLLKSVVVEEVIGQGNFGKVYRGQWYVSYNMRHQCDMMTGKERQWR